MLNVLLIGVGAIGREVLRHLESDPERRVGYALVRSTDSNTALSKSLPKIRFVNTVDEIEPMPDFAIECAGANAIREHVIPLLRRGVDVGLCSVSALVDEEVAAQLRQAAVAGDSQLHLLAGAVGGIDALASAKLLGLDSVTLTSRKPPIGWVGTPAEQLCDLRTLLEPLIIFSGCARAAAGLYPRNANAAATVALAGVGLDKTQITLVADPTVASNTHEISACGAFGEMRFVTSNRPMFGNPKTSALAALSAIRAIRNRSAAVTI
jgi:aspartate dehydrogenase